MGKHIRVSIPQMQRDGEKLHTQMEKIPQFVRELENAMQNLGSCWDGPAWITFQQQVASDILQMMEVYDWLRKYVQSLSEAEKAYGEGEKNGYESIKSVRI